MYRYLRDTHLLLGLFAVLFLLMYGISSVQMAHNRWFNLKPRVEDVRLTIGAGKDARGAAQELMDSHAMRGELTQIIAAPNGSKFRLVRPGTVYDIDYRASTGHVQARTSTAGFMGTLNRIHHVAGLWHGYSLINVWGAFVGIIAAILLTLGGTGVYLWFKIHHERAIGSVLLIASLGFGITILALIRTA